MTILSRYLSREIAKHFSMVLAMVICIYVAVDFFEKIDDFMEKNIPFSKVMVYFINKIPFIVAQITPVGILLAVLISFGLMSKNNELVALKSSGISIYALLKTSLGFGAAVSVALFLLSEILVPLTMPKSNRIWLQEVRNEQAVSVKETNIWIKGPRSILHINFYNAEKKTIRGVTLSRFDKGFQLVLRLDAETGVYQNGKWTLSEVMEQRLNPETGGFKTAFFQERAESLGFVPADLKRVMRKSEEMSYLELYRFIRKVESEGYDATAYWVDLYAKTALPFVCIIMSLVGTAIGVGGKIKEGLPISITYGIGITFLWWVLFSFCISLGYGGMLPPFLAAWTANLLFFCVGGILLINAE